MKINISKKQYNTLVKMCAIANSITGTLGDMIDDPEYKELSEECDEMEKYLLQFAKDFDHEEVTQDYDKRKILNDGYYEDSIAPIIDDYEEYITQSNLANKLAWRDFRRDHTEEELQKMRERNNGYFGVEIYEYEEKYWKEFEEYEFDRLEVRNII